MLQVIASLTLVCATMQDPGTSMDELFADVLCSNVPATACVSLSSALRSALFPANLIPPSHQILPIARPACQSLCKALPLSMRFRVCA